MKIYTKTGDDGTTSLVGGLRVNKTESIIEILGSVDELNAQIGIIVALNTDKRTLVLNNVFRNIQAQLFSLGSIVAGYKSETAIFADYTKSIEDAIDNISLELSELKHFILPGGSILASELHLARAICRRVERNYFKLKKFDTYIVSYLNRLSDYLFVLARYSNFKLGEAEILWKGS